MTATDAPSDGTPVGRRVVLGMLGLGAAGILVGSKVQDAFSRVLQPVTAADPSGLTSLIPAANASSLVVVPAKPLRANSAPAAARIFSLRSEAGIRV